MTSLLARLLQRPPTILNGDLHQFASHSFLTKAQEVAEKVKLVVGVSGSLLFLGAIVGKTLGYPVNWVPQAVWIGGCTGLGLIVGDLLAELFPSTSEYSWYGAVAGGGLAWAFATWFFAIKASVAS